MDVAIVGGGFSGTALTVQLLRRAKRGVSIAIVDREDRIARGVAYSASHKDRMLNVAAGKMSALADQPGHFLDWLATTRQLENMAQVFLPRNFYGDYLQDTLMAAARDSQHTSLRKVVGQVSSLRMEQDSILVECAAGEVLWAKTVVLATGNYPPPDPPEMKLAQPHRFIRYPWAPDALDGIRATDAVLILGSGLTAVDQIFTLKNRGFRGTIHVISSRGILPQAHQSAAAWSYDWEACTASSVTALLAAVREQIALAAGEGIGWRTVIDSLRRSSQTLWKALPLAERRRFLRHVRSFWDVHRHRVSPEVHQALQQLIAAERLVVHAGRCLSVSEEGEWATVRFRARGSSESEAIHINQIINCTGPSTIKRLSGDPLMGSIFTSGLCRPDAMGMGLDTDETGRLIDGQGNAERALFGIGPLRKGTLWETTAVPEIRAQALALADHLLALLEEQPVPRNGGRASVGAPVGTLVEGGSNA